MIFVLEFLVFAAVVLVVISQVIIPAVRGTLLFPWLQKTSDLEHDLAQAQQEIYDSKLAEEVEAVKSHNAKQ